MTVGFLIPDVRIGIVRRTAKGSKADSMKRSTVYFHRGDGTSKFTQEMIEGADIHKLQRFTSER
jgi:hypothetical protein